MLKCFPKHCGRRSGHIAFSAPQEGKSTWKTKKATSHSTIGLMMLSLRASFRQLGDFEPEGELAYKDESIGLLHKVSDVGRRHAEPTRQLMVPSQLQSLAGLG